MSANVSLESSHIHYIHLEKESTLGVSECVSQEYSCTAVQTIIAPSSCSRQIHKTHNNFLHTTTLKV